jgi:hypothetical protein
MGYGAYKFQLLLLLPLPPLGSGLGLGLGLGLTLLPPLLLLLPPLVNMLLVTGMNPSTVMHAAMTRMNISASVACKHRCNRRRQPKRDRLDHYVITLEAMQTHSTYGNAHTAASTKA